MSPSVEPFNEAKYKALMDGLECSEIKKSDLEFSGRIDAEYYQKKFLQYEDTVRKHQYLQLSKIADFLIGPFGSAYDTSSYVDQSDYRYIRGQDVKPFLLQDVSPRYMAENDYVRLKKYALNTNDILVSVVGTLGNACIVQEHEVPAIFSCKSTAIKVKQVNPFYLLSYLNSNYGKSLLLRKERGAIQKGLNLDDLKTLDVPIFSDKLSQKTEELIMYALDRMGKAKQSYAEAEKHLEVILGSLKTNPSKNYSIKMLADSFLSSGRLDAEYYQPKYDAFFRILDGFETTRIPNEFVVLKSSGSNYAESISDIGVIKTKQLTNSGVNIDGIESYFTKETCLENKSVFLANNDVVFASMGVGSLGKVSLFSYDGDRQFVTDSTLRIYRAKKTSRVLPEVLCVFLQSSIGQELIYRYVVGSTGIINIYDDDMAKIPVPILDQGIQKNIAVKVQESFALRRQAKQLLEYAKQVVEMAIEQGEDISLAWLKNKFSQLEV